MKRLLLLLFFILSSHSQAEEFHASGRISKVNLEERIIFIDEIPYKINEKTKFTWKKLNIDPDRLKPGTLVTFELHNALITSIKVESAIEFNE